MPNVESLVGKPLVIYKDRRRREVGRITSAESVPGGLKINATLTDEDVAEMLNKKPVPTDAGT